MGEERLGGNDLMFTMDDLLGDNPKGVVAPTPTEGRAARFDVDADDGEDPEDEGFDFADRPRTRNAQIEGTYQPPRGEQDVARVEVPPTPSGRVHGRMEKLIPVLPDPLTDDALYSRLKVELLRRQCTERCIPGGISDTATPGLFTMICWHVSMRPRFVAQDVANVLKCSQATIRRVTILLESAGLLMSSKGGLLHNDKTQAFFARFTAEFPDFFAGCDAWKPFVRPRPYSREQVDIASPQRSPLARSSKKQKTA